MNLKPNQHKRIYFNSTTMTSLGFIAPPLKFYVLLKISSPPPKFNFLLRSPQLFWPEIFSSPLKLGKGGGAANIAFTQQVINSSFCEVLI